MARIKTILSERMHAYGDAYAIQRQHREEAQIRREHAVMSKAKRAAEERQALLKAKEEDKLLQIPDSDPSEVTVEHIQSRRGRMARRRLQELQNASGQTVVESAPTSSSTLS